MSGEDVVSSIFATAEGGGAYKGMVARWDYSGVNVDKTHELSARGFIVETKVGSGYFPLQVQATRTERIEFHSGLITTPPAQPPYHSGAIATVDIVEEVAQVSFLGLATAESVLRGLCGSFSWGPCLRRPGPHNPAPRTAPRGHGRPHLPEVPKKLHHHAAYRFGVVEANLPEPVFPSSSRTVTPSRANRSISAASDSVGGTR